MTTHLFDLAGRLDFGDLDGEAAACRRHCALFDFSFVRRARLTGPHALGLLERFCGRRLGDLAPGRLRFALRRGPDGRLISDLTVWRLDDGGFELMTGRAEDLDDLFGPAGSALEDRSGETAVLSLQGPETPRILARLGAGPAASRLPFFGHAPATVGGLSCRIGRLGFSGEPGVELIAAQRDRDALWDALATEARPAGVGALDRLRIEAGLPLFCNEFAPGVTATEAGLERYLDAPAAPPRVKLVSFRAEAGSQPLLWRPSPRAGLPEAAGSITVTSACRSPVAGGILGLGYVRPSQSEPGRPAVDPDGAFEAIHLVPLPFLAASRERSRKAWRAGP